MYILTLTNFVIRIRAKILHLLMSALILIPTPVHSAWDRQGGIDLEEEFSAGFIRVCTAQGEHYETRAKNCPKGIFLKDPLIPGCVCMQGTYVKLSY